MDDWICHINAVYSSSHVSLWHWLIAWKHCKLPSTTGNLVCYDQTVLWPWCSLGYFTNYPALCETSLQPVCMMALTPTDPRITCCHQLSSSAMLLLVDWCNCRLYSRTFTMRLETNMFHEHFSALWDIVFRWDQMSTIAMLQQHRPHMVIQTVHTFYWEMITIRILRWETFCYQVE